MVRKIQRFKSYDIHNKGMNIKPTSVAEKDEKGNDLPIEFTLEDKDFLLITALNNLSNEIQKMRLSNGR